MIDKSQDDSWDFEGLYDIFAEFKWDFKSGRSIEKLKQYIEQIVAKAEKQVNDSWMYQKANDHDNRIREGILKELLAECEFEKTAKGCRHKIKEYLLNANQ